MSPSWTNLMQPLFNLVQGIKLLDCAKRLQSFFSQRAFSRHSVLSLLLVGVISNAFASTPGWLQQPITLADARHLSGRTGFGASGVELAALVGLSRYEAVKRIVDGINQTPYIPMPSWVREPAPRYWTRGTLPDNERQAFDQAREQEIAGLRQWWVNNLLQSDSPQTERLVMFWHDHFATSYDGVNRQSISIAKQNQLFRQMGTGSYRAFLKALIRDPAMLIYLNNHQNRKGRPNENLARELLELFTLGEGHYDEDTVKEAARALTGYGVSQTRNNTFRLYAYKHDTDEKTLFGVTGNHDGDTLIDLILEQPEAARHLVKKFWVAFVSDREPDVAFVDSLSQTFRDADYNLLTLYKAVLQSPQFWDEANRLSLIKSPATLLIGTARSLDFPKRRWSQLASLHGLLGMKLFAPPNVSGWQEGIAFVAPGRLLNRQLALQTMLAESSVVTPAKSASMMSDKRQMDAALDAPAPLQLRLAGHLFQGAPRYKVSLYESVNGQDKKQWESDARELQLGYDTQMFGAMQDRNLLPWLTESYYPPENILAKASTFKVEFLNDAASKLGDRNLFIESVSLNAQTFSAVGAMQESSCVPKSKRFAGDLYCAGSVSIDLTNTKPATLSRVDAFTATDAHVIWTNNAGPKLDAIIALENVQTPDRFFHTVSFHIVSKNDDVMDLRIDSFSCWPDCIDVWPECAWSSMHSDEKHVNFPLNKNKKNNNRCHYENLSINEQQLVDTLWASVPSVLSHVSNNESRKKHMGNLALWLKRIDKLNQKINTSDYAKNTTPISINEKYETPLVRPQPLEEPKITITSLFALDEQMKASELSLADLLIGGGDVAQMPEFQANTQLPVEVELEKLISHPVYQVY